MSNTVSYLSYSSFTTYLECGEKFRLSRIEKVPEDPAWWLIGGTAVHSALDVYDLALPQVGKHDAYGAALEEFNSQLTKEMNTPGNKRSSGRGTKKYPNGEDGSWWRDNGPNYLHAWSVWREQNPQLDIWTTPEGVPAVELEFNINLPGDVNVKGFADRVMVDKTSGELLIVDNKTGKNTPPSALQLAFYRIGMENTFNESPRFGAYWMARTGAFPEVHDLSRYSTEMVSRWLRNVRKAIDLEMFTPNRGRNCDWCGLKDSCYAYNPAVPPPVFLSDITNTLESESPNE